jgi:hypothetical protein
MNEYLRWAENDSGERADSFYVEYGPRRTRWRRDLRVCVLVVCRCLSLTNEDCTALAFIITAAAPSGRPQAQLNTTRTQCPGTRAVESVHKSSDSPIFKRPTPTPRFLKVRLRLLHKSSICINNGKPIRHFIATTWIIRLLFRLITYI